MALARRPKLALFSRSVPSDGVNRPNRRRQRGVRILGVGRPLILAPDGTTVRAQSVSGNPFVYTGRRLDQETGLYHYRARYYDASLGRFLSRDPMGEKAGLNWYCYVGDRPTSHVDPSGLFDPVFFGGGAGTLTAGGTGGVLGGTTTVGGGGMITTTATAGTTATALAPGTVTVTGGSGLSTQRSRGLFRPLLANLKQQTRSA